MNAEEIAKVGIAAQLGAVNLNDGEQKAFNVDRPVITAGQPWSFKVNNLGALKSLLLRIAVTVSTGATPGTPTARTRNPVEMAGDIVFTVNNKPLISMGADLAFCLAQYLRGAAAPLELDSLTNAELAAGSTTPGASVEIPLDMIFPDFDPAQGGLLPLQQKGEVIVKGQMGQIANLMNSAGATQALSGTPTLVPTVVRISQNPNPLPFAFGAYVRAAGQKLVAQTGFDTFNLQTSGRLIALAIRASSGSTNDPSDSVLTAGQPLEIKVNGQTYYEAVPEVIAQRTGARFPSSISRTGFYLCDLTRSSQADKAQLEKAPVVGNGVSTNNCEVKFHGTTGTNTRLDYVPVVQVKALDNGVNWGWTVDEMRGQLAARGFLGQA